MTPPAERRPGERNRPCQAEYGIAITRDLSGARADIVVIDLAEAGLQHTPLLDAQTSRDLVLNKILSTDLRGIRLDLTRFFVIVDTESPTEMTGYEFPIQLDVDDYRRKGNPVQIRDVVPTSINSWLRYVLGFYEKRVSVMNRDVVGGCATAKTDVERRRRGSCGGGALGTDRRGISGKVALVERRGDIGERTGHDLDIKNGHEHPDAHRAIAQPQPARIVRCGLRCRHGERQGSCHSMPLPR